MDIVDILRKELPFEQAYKVLENLKLEEKTEFSNEDKQKISVAIMSAEDIPDRIKVLLIE